MNAGNNLLQPVTKYWAISCAVVSLIGTIGIVQKTSLVFDAYKDELNQDTVFSGTIIKAIRLEAVKAGKMSIVRYI